MTEQFLKSIEKGALVTLAGRPSMGKTTFALNIITNLAIKSKEPVAVFSLEFSSEHLVQRMICSEAEIEFQNLKSTNIQRKDMEKLAKVVNEISEAPIQIDDNPSSIDDIENKIKKLKLDFVFIDYLQLIESSGEKTRKEEIDDIMKRLKNTAKENKCTIFLLSQLSRAVESRCEKRPVLSDLRESKLIEEMSDVVMFIHRPAYYEGDKEDTNTELIIAKNNYGECKTINIEFNPDVPKFYIENLI